MDSIFFHPLIVFMDISENFEIETKWMNEMKEENDHSLCSHPLINFQKWKRTVRNRRSFSLMACSIASLVRSLKRATAAPLEKTLSMLLISQEKLMAGMMVAMAEAGPGAWPLPLWDTVWPLPTLVSVAATPDCRSCISNMTNYISYFVLPRLIVVQNMFFRTNGFFMLCVKSRVTFLLSNEILFLFHIVLLAFHESTISFKSILNMLTSHYVNMITIKSICIGLTLKFAQIPLKYTNNEQVLRYPH